MSAIGYDALNSRAPRKPMRMSPMARRAAISSTLGSALEWIDFTAYGAVAATVVPVVNLIGLTADAESRNASVL